MNHPTRTLMSTGVDPAAVYDLFMKERAPASRDQRRWTSGDGPMPALYLSHGSPALFEDAVWMNELFDWSQALPTPTAILIVSAHWESAPLSLSASGPSTPLVYDFGGFAQRYFEMTYDTPDASALAARVAASMPDSEPVHQHVGRGLDHGAWVPLKTMYPYGDIPVLQMSLPTHRPARLLEIGRRLQGLREEGVLVIGSGYLTHGVRFLTRENFVRNTTLASYDSLAPAVSFAHPTVEHYIPMFVTLGAAVDAGTPVRTTIEGYRFGLSKRSFEVA
jgi:4,5-DOPA dioxygenase extradiol